MTDNHIEPRPVIDRVENYVRRESVEFELFSNRSPFDESGVWDLHQLARDIYALGVEDGTGQERWRNSQQRQRDRDDQKKTAAEEGES